VIAGSKTAGRFVTILILVVFVLFFVAVVIWLRKKKSPDPKPTLHTQIISPCLGTVICPGVVSEKKLAVSAAPKSETRSFAAHRQAAFSDRDIPFVGAA